MKVTPTLGGIPSSLLAMSKDPDSLILSKDIPAQLRDVQVEYAIKSNLHKMMPEIDIKLIDQAVDNVGLFRFVSHLKDDPDNSSIKALLSKALWFELECVGAEEVDFCKVLNSI